jgi:hypothetical protein
MTARRLDFFSQEKPMPRHLLLVPGFILIVCLSAASQPKGTNAPQANNSNDKAARDASFAVEDYEKAIDLARAFQHDAPRANATMAIVRAILKEKKK